MRILLFSAALLLALLLVLLAGWLLPATREGRAEAVIAAPPERILAVIADVEAQPEWRGGIASVTREGAGWREVTARGETITFTPVEMGEARIHLTFTSSAGYSGEIFGRMAGRSGGGRGRHTDRGGGTRHGALAHGADHLAPAL